MRLLLFRIIRKFSRLSALGGAFLCSLLYGGEEAAVLSLARCLDTPPAWMDTQIAADFAPFEKEGIKRSAVETFPTHPQNDGFFSCKIEKGRCFIDVRDKRWEERARALSKAVQRLSVAAPLPDMTCIVCLHDSSREPCQQNVPILVFAKGKERLGDVLIPDFEALRGYHGLQSKIRSQAVRWERKVEKCFWRGATTGGDFTPEQWRSLPRAQLVLLSLQHPQWLDARFTHFVQGAEKNREMQQMPQLLAPSVSPVSSLRFKYLMDIDGNTCGYSRCYWTLLSNSVVFKQQTDQIQWYYGALRPYEHYIPVKTDLSDLISQIQWAKKEDAKARQIANQATDFVLQNLQEEHIYLYLYKVLQKYASLLH